MKPSGRINEIWQDIVVKQGAVPKNTRNNMWIQAVIQYLNEEWERNQIEYPIIGASSDYIPLKMPHEKAKDTQ